MVPAALLDELTMIMLSDAQAETVCGGTSRYEQYALERASRLSERSGRSYKYNLAPRAIAQQVGGNNAITLLIAPLINLSFVIAVNGSNAIGGNQSNTLTATVS